MSDRLSLTGPLHLVVAWISRASTVGRVVKTSDEVTAGLRGHVQSAIDRLGDSVPYAPDAEVEDNSHMYAPIDESIDMALIQELRKGPSLPLATEDELRSKDLKCHAVLVTDSGKQILFVRKRTPIQLARKSLVGTLLSGKLDRLESPILAFEDKFDAIITPNVIHVLNKKAFEGLFKDSPAVLAKTRMWIDEVSKSVPFADGSADALEDILRRNSFLRTKFLAVRGRSHLKYLTPARLRAEMVRHGFDPSILMDGEALKVTNQNAKEILRLLNEDFFIGGFSETHYAASAKRPIS